MGTTYIELLELVTRALEPGDALVDAARHGLEAPVERRQLRLELLHLLGAAALLHQLAARLVYVLQVRLVVRYVTLQLLIE